MERGTPSNVSPEEQDRLRREIWLEEKRLKENDFANKSFESLKPPMNPDEKQQLDDALRTLIANEEKKLAAEKAWIDELPADDGEKKIDNPEQIAV